MAADTESHRRCVLTRTAAPRADLLRLVIGPDGQVVADVAEKLPGRGAWVSLSHSMLVGAVRDGRLAKGLSRAFKTQVRGDQIAPDFVGDVTRLLERRVLDRLGQLKRSGELTVGLDKIRTVLSGRPARPGDVILSAADVGQDGAKKIHHLAAGQAAVSQVLTRDQLSQAVGGGNVVHVLARASNGSHLLQEALARYKRMVHEALPDGAETDK